MTTSSMFYQPSTFQQFNYKTMLRMPEEQDDPFIRKDMKFGERNQKLKRRKVASLSSLKNIKKLTQEGDIMPFQDCSDNMIFANLQLEEFSKPSVRHLLESYQYALECLYNKQETLEFENAKLKEQYEEIRNSSFTIEETLKMNKQQISHNNKCKTELRHMLTQFQAIFSEYGQNPGNSENQTVQKILDKNSGGRYHCHICTGKGFSTEEKLESHMKRRHLNIKAVEGLDESSLEDSFALYSKQIDDMKKHFETLLKEQEQEQFMKTYLDNQIKGREATEKRINDLEKTLKDTLIDFKSMIVGSMVKQQNQQPVYKDDEAAKRTHEELMRLTQSIGDMNKLICHQYEKKIDNLQNEVAFLKGKSSQPIPQEKIIYVEQPRQQIQQPVQQNVEKKVIVETKQIEKTIVVDKSLNEDDNHNNNSNIKQSVISNVNKEEEIKNDSIKQSIGFKKKQVPSEINESSQLQSIVIPKEEPKQIRNDIINEPDSQLLPKPPEISSKTQKIAKKFFKRVHLANRNSKTMTAQDELSEFFKNFMNRDNAILDLEEPLPEQYCEQIIPEHIPQNQENIQKLMKEKIENSEIRQKIPYESYAERSKKELINVIDETLENISKLNQETEMGQAYFEAVQKAIDLKLYEADKEAMKKENDNDNVNLKNSQFNRNASRISASQVINQIKEEFEEDEVE